MEEIDGGLEVVAAMERIVVIQEAEVGVTVENTTVVGVAEAIVGVILEVVVLSVIVQVSNGTFVSY